MRKPLRTKKTSTPQEATGHDARRREVVQDDQEYSEPHASHRATGDGTIDRAAAPSLGGGARILLSCVLAGRSPTGDRNLARGTADDREIGLGVCVAAAAPRPLARGRTLRAGDAGHTSELVAPHRGPARVAPIDSHSPNRRWLS